MKHIQQAVLFSLFFFCAASVSARIEFGNKHSRLALDQGVTVGAPVVPMSVVGEFSHDVGTSTQGQAVWCGPAEIFKRSSATGFGREQTARLYGWYTLEAEGPSRIFLNGGCYLDADEGYVVDFLSVDGENNIIAGYPTFATAPVIGEGVVLTYMLEGMLDMSPVLAGGTLRLGEDMRCEKDVFIAGTGTVLLGNKQLFLAPLYTAPITGALVWVDAHSIELTGKTPVAAQWTFEGRSLIEGNGARLELTPEARILIASGATLTLRDIEIGGVTNDTFVFADTTSTLELQNSRLEIATSVVITTGTTIANGNFHTFVLDDKNITFSHDARFIVDGGRVWLDVYSHPEQPLPGSFLVPRAVYITPHHYSTENMLYNTGVNGNLTLLNFGSISEVNDGMDDVKALFNEEFFKRNSMLAPDDVITIRNSMSVDGRGSRVLFANPGTPQCILEDGVVLTLKNIELAGLRDTTFKFGEGACLQLDGTALFTIAEDMHWNYGDVRILEGATFRIQSDGPVHSFILQSPPQGRTPERYVYRKYITLNSADFELYNIAFMGLRHVEMNNSIFLMLGKATVSINEPKFSHNFKILSTDNHWNLLNSNITYAGQVVFGDTGPNVLHLDFAYDERTSVPKFYLGSRAFTLASQTGQAVLSCEDITIGLVNTAPDSLIGGVHGYLMGSALAFYTNPILQTSARFTVGAELSRGDNVGLPLVRDENMMRSIDPQRRAFGFSEENGRRQGEKS